MQLRYPLPWKDGRDRLQAILAQLDISEDYVQAGRLSLFLNWLRLLQRPLIRLKQRIDR